MYPLDCGVHIDATHLKQRRIAAGLTQRELAHRLGIRQNYVPAIEANTRQAGLNLHQAICDILGRGFSDLFEVVLVDDVAGKETRFVPCSHD